MTANEIPDYIEGYSKVIPYANKLREIKVKEEKKENMYFAEKTECKPLKTTFIAAMIAKIFCGFTRIKPIYYILRTC